MTNILKMLLILGFIFGSAFVIITCVAASKDASHHVIKDLVDQYNLTVDHGTDMDMCVRAGLVKEAYLQVKNEAKYTEWSGIEADDCQRAGLRRHR